MKRIYYSVFCLGIYLALSFSSLANTINSIRILSSISASNLVKIANILNHGMAILEYILIVVVVLLLILNKTKGKEKLIGILFILRGIIGIVLTVLCVSGSFIYQNEFKTIVFAGVIIAILRNIVFIMAGLGIIKGNADVPTKAKIILLSAFYVVLYFINSIQNMKVIGTSYNSFSLLRIINFIVLILGLLHIGNAFFSEKDVKYVNSSSIIAIIVFVIIIFAISGGLGSSGGSSGRGGTCKSCGRKFAAGDEGGNYMSVARRGMCKNCYNNYDSMKEFLD